MDTENALRYSILLALVGGFSAISGNNDGWAVFGGVLLALALVYGTLHAFGPFFPVVGDGEGTETD